MTKKQLRQRLMDLAQGSMGHNGIDFETGDDNPMGMLGWMGIDEWFRWILAARRALGGELEERAFEIWNLHHFETLDGAVEHLWEFRKDCAENIALALCERANREAFRPPKKGAGDE